MINNSENMNNNSEVEIVDLEQIAKNNGKPPKGKKYKYKVDDEDFISETETMTGREILESAVKIPVTGFILRQKVKGSWLTVKLDDVVDFTTPGLEKFKTLPNDQTEGSDDDSKAKSPRRDFALLEEEEEFMDKLELFWETVNFNGQNWIFIHDYPVVEGYNIPSATVAFLLPPTYPASQIDMVYIYPGLQRTDGQPIGALSDFPLDGKNFQRWSRHRTALNPWRSNIDNITTHYPLVEAWLLKEFEKRPKYA